MGILDWLLGGNAVEAAGKQVETRAGKKAYRIAAEIMETEDKPRWKELMDVYYGTAKPEAKVEVLNIAAALAKTAKVRNWKREVQSKTNQLKKRGYL